MRKRHEMREEIGKGKIKRKKEWEKNKGKGGKNGQKWKRKEKLKGGKNNGQVSKNTNHQTKTFNCTLASLLRILGVFRKMFQKL